jgi:hypothetical protein
MTHVLVTRRMKLLKTSTARYRSLARAARGDG